jgi:NRPS condensation-like uncharacterized protein
MGMQPIRLTAIDEGILLWEEASVPWNIQLDVSAPRLDPERLRAAYDVALAHHELASCSVQPDGRGGWAWVRSPSPVDIGPIEVVECADDEAVEHLRSAQLDAAIPLDRAPLARAVIARRPDDDLLLSSVSHVLTDGMGLLRLLRSVARAYTGAPDPEPVHDVVAAHRVLAPRLPTGLAGLTQRLAAGLGVASTSIAARTRVSPSTAAVGDGWGVITRAVDVGTVTDARRALDASFDDLMTAAMHVTIDRWNRSAGVDSRGVGVALGVNLRDAGWNDDVVANLATFVSVLTGPPHRGDLAEAVATIRPHLAQDARRERARLVLDATRAVAAAPLALRRHVLRSTNPDLLDSAVLSNCGVVADPPRFEHGHEPEVWFSPPTVPAVGLAMGVVTVGSTVRIALRYRRERFDAAGAGAFVDTYLDALTDR